VELLERCTRTFTHDPRYRNDERYIKVLYSCVIGWIAHATVPARLWQLWIKYADCMTDPDEIFKFMHKNKIGARVALFWVAWAFVNEKAGNDKFTDKLFVKGIEMKVHCYSTRAITATLPTRQRPGTTHGTATKPPEAVSATTRAALAQ
jgi:hypothetical protein